MSFLGKYQIVSMIGEGETRTFRAREASTGRSVVLHQLLRSRTSPHQRDLASMVFKYLPRVGAQGPEQFVDMGEDEDRVFIVTADVPECLDLRKWLQSIADLQGDRGISPRPSQIDPDATQKFSGLRPESLQEGLLSTDGTLTLSSPQSALSEPATPDSEKTQDIEVTPLPQAPPGSQREPGEFTRMFSAPGSKKESPGSSASQDEVSLRPPAQPVPPASQEAAKKSPGEFTQMFFGKDIAGQKAAPPAPPPTPDSKLAPAIKPADKHPRGQVPSGFEVVFQSRKQPPRAGAPQDPPGPKNVPPAQVPAKTGSPGEFTQIFSGMSKDKAEPPQSPLTPGEPPSAPPPPSQRAGPGEFTQIFYGVGKGKVEAPLAESPVTPSKPPSAPPPPSQKAGPGEFTQIFYGVGKDKAGQPTTSSSPPVRTTNVPSPQPPAEKAGSGEFTQLFHTPLAKGEPSEVPAPSLAVTMPSVPLPASPPPKGPGEFTLIFKAGAQAPSKVEPPQSEPRLGSTMPPAGSESRAATPNPLAFPASRSDSPGPGEFTQLFQSGGEPMGGGGLLLLAARPNRLHLFREQKRGRVN